MLGSCHITVTLNCYTKHIEIRKGVFNMIRLATFSDYKKIAISLGKIEKLSYINKVHLKEDIEKEQCYLKIVKGKIVAIGSLVFDKEYNMYYVKRVIVMNKKYHRKGYGKELISHLSKLKKPVAITPFKENEKMKKLIEGLGFTFKYSFLENFQLYVKN